MTAMCLTEARQESLASFLTRVRPGDNCACCGAHLQAAAGPSPGGLSSSQGAVSAPGERGPQPSVICPVCGCEVSDEDDPDAGHSRRLLVRAA